MKSTEREDAIRLANRVLEQPHRDPDDDLSMLSRQFLRAEEALKSIVCAFCGKESPRGDNPAETMATHIAECEKHPMRAAVQDNVKLRAIVRAYFVWQAEEVNELMPIDLRDAVIGVLGKDEIAAILADEVP